MLDPFVQTSFLPMQALCLTDEALHDSPGHHW